MPHLDEGTIHAWLDGALSPADARDVEAHAAACASCAAVVAEARGLIAASSRVLSALDSVPRDVTPPVASPRAATPVRRWSARWAGIAAAIALATAGALVLRRAGVADRGATAMSRREMPAASSAQSIQVAAAPPAAESVAQPATPSPASAAAIAPQARVSSARGKPSLEKALPRKDAEVRNTLAPRIAAGTSAADSVSPRQRAGVAAAPSTRDSAALADEQPSNLAASVDTRAPKVEGDLSRARSEALRPSSAPSVLAMPVPPAVASAAANQPARRVAQPNAPVLLHLLRTTTRSVNEHTVTRKIYEVRPGVEITLDKAALLAETQAPIDGRPVPRPAAKSTAVAGAASGDPEDTARVEQELAARPGWSSIQWTDSLGNEYTLTGRMSVEELRRLKPLVH